MNTDYRPDIDGLRAIAVVSVLVYHAELYLNGYQLLPAGFLGVDIFFVISGYLITKILLTEITEQRFSIARFYERRARRILPVLFLVILCTMPFAWWLMLPPAMEDYAGSVITSILYSSNFWFWSGDSYWGLASALKPLLHTWSLSLEEQFYLIIPWVILLLAKKTMLMTICFSALAIASIVIAEIWSSSHSEAAFYLLPARAWELLAGSMIALRSLKESSQTRHIVAKECLTALGLVMILGSIIVFDSELRHPSLITLIPVVGSALVIANGAKTKVSLLITSKPMLFIGLLSYSIYLWHFPIFAFLKIAHIQLNLVERLACMALSVLLAFGSYHLVEKPVRNHNKVSLKRFLHGLAVSITIMMAFSIWAYSSKGLPNRFDDYDNVLSYLNYPFEEPFLSHSCFLHPEDLLAKTGFKNCQFNGTEPSAKPSMMLWGDSNAAHLIPGIRDHFEQSHQLIIRTISGCAVFTRSHIPKRPGCDILNKQSLQLILDQQPDQLVIAGWWKPEFVEKLSPTLNQLKDSGVKNVVVVGPVPEWSPSLPARIFRFHEEHLEARNFPDLLIDRKHAAIHETDRKMKAMVEKFGYRYFSSMQYLCSDTGCLTNVNGELIQWDYGHLTAEGAVYLIEGLNNTLNMK
jgi:peptidoglycan/LPS O-acetylase OafA/YrhL